MTQFPTPSAYPAAHGIRELIQTSVILVGLKGSSADEWLIRYAVRLAGLSDATLTGGLRPRLTSSTGRRRARLEKDRPLLGELDGTLLEVRADDTASGLIRAARAAGACQLVIGARRRPRWSRRLNRPPWPTRCSARPATCPSRS